MNEQQDQLLRDLRRAFPFLAWIPDEDSGTIRGSRESMIPSYQVEYVTDQKIKAEVHFPYEGDRFDLPDLHKVEVGSSEDEIKDILRPLMEAVGNHCLEINEKRGEQMNIMLNGHP